MGARLGHFWNVLTSSYWFVPLAMTVGGGGAAVLALQFGVRSDSDASGASWSWLYSGGSDGAWALLSAIAGSIITVGGVAFSITIVTLTQASSQFGPRLLRSFMRDGHNQAVLGAFMGTFVYSLTVLRTVRSADEGLFVPQLAVTGAFLLAIVCVALLVYFLHRTARSLQAPVVVAALGQQLLAAIAKHLRPAGSDSDDNQANDGGRDGPADDRRGRQPAAQGKAVLSDAQEGYLQVIDEGGLLRLAERLDLTLVLACRPGTFVAPGSSLLTAYPATRLDDAAVDSLREAFILGEQRTEEQDAEFVLHQLVEIAVRALSPGINDPHTALTCIDWLGGGLRELARGRLRGPARRAEDGQIRMFTLPFTFAGLVESAFGEIRQFGTSSTLVTLRLMKVLGELGEAAPSEEQRAALRRQVELTYQQAVAQIFTGDHARLEEGYQGALRATAGEERGA